MSWKGGEKGTLEVEIGEGENIGLDGILWCSGPCNKTRKGCSREDIDRELGMVS